MMSQCPFQGLARGFSPRHPPANMQTQNTAINDMVGLKIKMLSDFSGGIFFREYMMGFLEPLQRMYFATY